MLKANFDQAIGGDQMKKSMANQFVRKTQDQITN